MQDLLLLFIIYQFFFFRLWEVCIMILRKVSYSPRNQMYISTKKLFFCDIVFKVYILIKFYSSLDQYKYEFPSSLQNEYLSLQLCFHYSHTSKSSKPVTQLNYLFTLYVLGLVPLNPIVWCYVWYYVWLNIVINKIV